MPADDGSLLGSPWLDRHRPRGLLCPWRTEGGSSWQGPRARAGPHVVVGSSPSPVPDLRCWPRRTAPSSTRAPAP